MVGITAICRGALRDMRMSNKNEFNTGDFIDAVLTKRKELATFANPDIPIMGQLRREVQKGVVIQTSKNRFRLK